MHKKKRLGNGEGGCLLISCCCILALCAVITPLLMNAQYNYPSADDWSFSKRTYDSVQAGGGIVKVLFSAFETVANYRGAWEGRFTIPFLGALQPGIWGEECYGVVTWILLGGLILGEIALFGGIFGQDGQIRGRIWLPIVLFTLIMQVLYTPSVIESFYWYNGGVNYTFVFAMSLVFVMLFIKLALSKKATWKLGVMAIISGILAIMIGGGNYSTSLSILLFMVLFYISVCVYGSKGGKKEIHFNTELFKKILGRTWYLLLLEGGSFLVCLLAPGNTVRLARNFGGATRGVGWAVWMSLVRSATNIYSWTNIKIILMLLLILPFAWQAVKNMKFDFRWPAFFTLLTFGLYASQIAPTMYVDGTTGGGRMAAILYYSYHIWLVGNMCYWVGWSCKRRQKWSAFSTKFFSVMAPFARKYLIPYCVVIGIVLTGVIYCFDLKEISSYKAYRDWRQGWAQQYALEWQERLEVLHDDSVKQVEFAPLSVYPETILYTDLQDEEGYTWVNSACAKYYDKEYVHIMPRSDGRTG
ncbi:MAG: hypothetical protein NC092_06350 [Butyrivibrio sp.]|nr:hypothetical protein [Muribaculum sp.]MCM1552296.1 hypothetical protein [Butyrivibrio sp.]